MKTVNMLQEKISFFKEVLRLLAPSKNNRTKFISVIVLTFLMAVLEAVGVGSIGPLVALTQRSDSFLDSTSGQFLASLFSVQNQDDLLLYLGATLVAIFVFKMIVTMLHAYMQHSYSHAFYSSISTRLLEGYTKMPFHFHSQQNSAILTRNVTTETRLIVDNIVRQGITFASELLVCTLLVSVLVALNPQVALTVCLVSGTVIALMLLSTRRYGSRYGQIRDEQQQEMIKTAQSLVTGLKEIILSGNKSFFLNRFENLATTYGKSVTIIGFIQIIPRITLEAVALLAMISAFVYTKHKGTMEQDLPLLVTYIVAGYRMLPSFNRIFVSGLMIYYVVPTLKQSMPSLFQALDATEEHASHILSPHINNITLQDISYRYAENSPNILKDVDLALNKGSISGIVGASGAGKSTLIGVLLGLLPPQLGEIRCDEKTLQTPQDLRDLQSKVAYVAQQVFIADDTLLANIALGENEKNIDFGRLNSALQIAQLESVVNELPDGLHTYIGEKAARLSGGQAQRVGIARAIYANRPILVLDEATSALDIQTEKRILDGLASNKDDRITVLIAHRTTALSECDCIYRLDDGVLEQPISFEEYLEKVT